MMTPYQKIPVNCGQFYTARQQVKIYPGLFLWVEPRCR